MAANKNTSANVIDAASSGSKPVLGKRGIYVGVSVTPPGYTVVPGVTVPGYTYPGIGYPTTLTLQVALWLPFITVTVCVPGELSVTVYERPML